MLALRRETPMNKFNIYLADFAKAGYKEIGNNRPCVVLSNNGSTAKVLRITSRNKEQYNFCVHINNYIVHGYCDTSKIYEISSKYLHTFRRKTTLSEERAILSKLRSKKP